MRTSKPCEHAADLAPVTPRTKGCEECAAQGASWNELRVCLICGHVGCCEDSPYQHALAHFKATGHPMIASLDRSETWSWCYLHGRYYELAPELRPGRTGIAALVGRLFGR